ncbi:MAG: acyloxyacyl hydrolase [Bacteroidetes bacterium]|nr:acyloxyacyl hydrolase [Bacteroidota bacterium]
MVVRFWMVFLLTGLLALLQSIPANGQLPEQPIRNRLIIEPLFRTGNILDIYSNLPDHSWARALEVNIAWQTAGKQYWNQYYRFPQTGVLLSGTYLGNPGELGYELSVVPNISYRFKQFGKFNFYGFIGLGFAWFNKPYDRIENPNNKMVGSRLTNKTILGLDLDYELCDFLTASTGISYMHYSNGHYQLPNVGINIPGFQIGLKYFPSRFPDKFIHSDSTHDFNRNWLLNVRIGMGLHEFGDPVKPTGGPKYPVYNGSVYISKRTGVVTNFTVGFHFNYYTSFYDFIRSQELYEKNMRRKSFSIIAFGGIEFLFGHLAFSGQVGINLYNPFLKEIQKIRNENTGFKNVSKEYLTLKLGSQFYVFNTLQTTKFNPWIGLFLKTNAGQADFVEISIGCAF